MLEKVLNYYPVNNPRAILEIMVGLINQTYKIDTDEGSFILQKLNPIFTPKSIEDVNAVSQYLKSKELITQEIIKTRNGKLWVEEKKEIWRLMTYIPGEVFTKIENPNIAYEAGKILGQFHHALADFKYNFRHHRIMHHATEKHLKLFLKVIRSNEQEMRNNSDIENLKKTILGLSKLLLPKNLRRTITHGDPKISNVIFRAIDRARIPITQAIALIDLDDVGDHHSPLIELGDAFRSWCGGYEDDPKNTFNLEKFMAALQGYLEGSSNFLTKKELGLLPQAIKLITLELASRFLRDYFEDCYFGWNPKKYTSRQAHNLARTRGQVALYNDILKKDHEITFYAKN